MVSASDVPKGTQAHTYSNLYLSGKILPYLVEVDTNARAHIKLLIKQMKKADGITEEL